MWFRDFGWVFCCLVELVSTHWLLNMLNDNQASKSWDYSHIISSSILYYLKKYISQIFNVSKYGPFRLIANLWIRITSIIIISFEIWHLCVMQTLAKFIWLVFKKFASILKNCLVSVFFSFDYMKLSVCQASCNNCHEY